MVPKTIPHEIKRGIPPKTGPLAVNGGGVEPPLTKTNGRIVLQTN
jgi:hypothetical protein